MGTLPLANQTALVEAAVGVLSEADLDKVLRRLVSEAITATGATYGALGVIGEYGMLSDFVYEGINAEKAREIGHLPEGKGVLGTVVRSNKTLRLDSIADHPDAYGFPEHHPPMSNFLGVPVAVGDVTFGNLYLTEKVGGFTDEDVELVESLSSIAGAAVQTARIQGRLRRVAVVEDRQRIAREMHDSVIQELFAVGLGLQGLGQLIEDAGATSTLDDAIDRLDHAVESLRGHIFELSVPGRDQLSLTRRIEEIVQRLSSAYPADVTLHSDIEDTGDSDLNDEICKIVSEALSNALRHASAERVVIHLGREADDYVLKVVDDGAGFDPTHIRTGMGLGNLRVRAGRLGGELLIRSSFGEGTEITARLPAP